MDIYIYTIYIYILVYQYEIISVLISICCVSNPLPTQGSKKAGQWLTMCSNPARHSRGRNQTTHRPYANGIFRNLKWRSICPYIALT